MDIYSILASKPHNPHYLNRYITFVKQCQQKNIGYEGYVERHHICPKANDMFPEYIDFRLHPWNCAVLTARQHFIAHLILWKTYPDFYSQEHTILSMQYTRDDIGIKGSKLYEKLKLKIKNTSTNMIPVKDSKGNTFSVSKDDTRYLLGEYKHVVKGMIHITNGKENKRFPKDEEIPKGWFKGRTYDFQWITNNIENRLIAKDASIPEGWCRGRKNNFQWITNGKEDQQISRDALIPEGWREGRTCSPTSKTIWVTNGKENRMIPKDGEIPKGWCRGKTQKGWSKGKTQTK